MRQKPAANESRTPEQLREHYEVEKELANRLRNASKEERSHLYSSLYDELYRRVPNHPQLLRKASPQEKARSVNERIKFLRPFLTPGTIFLEVGPGDCALSFEVAKNVKSVYAVDVSDVITHSIIIPQNFNLIISDGCQIPVPPGSIDIAYSNQLMEHLHPDDALEQLQNIYTSLKVGGKYICITPNRLTGPHDISMYFDDVATGFHLREYTIRELSALFRKAGFKCVHSYVHFMGEYVPVPIWIRVIFAQVLLILPSSVRRSLVKKGLIKKLLSIRMMGIK